MQIIIENGTLYHLLIEFRLFCGIIKTKPKLQKFNDVVQTAKLIIKHK